MAPLLFVCPKTNQQAPTGIETDVQSLSASWKATLKVNCPYCGGVHEISVRETYLNGVLGIHCCRDDDDLAKAVRHMEKLQVRRLPVINKSRRMIGILSLGDISNSAPGDLLSECVRSVSAHH